MGDRKSEVIGDSTSLLNNSSVTTRFIALKLEIGGLKVEVGDREER